MPDRKPPTIEEWVKEYCVDIQGPLGTAEQIAAQGVGASQFEAFRCPKPGCEVCADTIKTRVAGIRKARLVNPERCLNLPPLDVPLSPPKEPTE